MVPNSGVAFTIGVGGIGVSGEKEHTFGTENVNFGRTGVFTGNLEAPGNLFGETGSGTLGLWKCTS